MTKSFGPKGLDDVKTLVDAVKVLRELVIYSRRLDEDGMDAIISPPTSAKVETVG